MSHNKYQLNTEVELDLRQLTKKMFDNRLSFLII